MPNVIDLSGQRFGRLTVIKRVENGNGGRARWLCRCDCGNEKTVLSGNLRSGDIQSCGCLWKELTSARSTRHGLHHTRLYSIWIGMIHRCTDEKHIYYKHYGGRGIKVCSEWLNSVTAFYDWAMGNGYSDELTIDRIDPDGDYEPSNCRWATAKVQASNKRKTIRLEINGETKTMDEWSKTTGVKYATIYARYKRGKTGFDLIKP